MDKLKVYQVAILLLLVANIGLVAFFLLGPHQRGHHPPPAKYVLNLDQDQNERFLSDARAHKRIMRNLSNEQRDILDVWFAQLKERGAAESLPVPPPFIELEKQKLRKTYDHLALVKGMLREDQMVNYPRFVDQNLQRMLGRQKGRRNGR